MTFLSYKTLLSFFALSGLLAAEDGFTNYIEMVEMGSGSDGPLLWNMPGNIAAEGNNVLIGQAVPAGGATFILSTIQAAPFNDFYLAQTSVGAYLPNAQMSVITHDNTSLTPRIRADQPFHIQATVSGLYDASVLTLPDGSVPLAARETRIHLFNQAYGEGENSLPGGEIASESYLELALEGNGDFPQGADDLTFYTTLNPENPLKARGEEHVVIRSLADGNIEGSALDQVNIEVWPVWGGTQSGLENNNFVSYAYSGAVENMVAGGEGNVPPQDDFQADPNEVSYVGVPPDMTFYWKDLFPTSEISIIVTDAESTHPWGGQRVVGTRRVFTENESFDYDMTLTKTEWNNVFSGPGRYAVWMVAYTPGIGWEVGGNYDSAGNLNPGGWVVPISKPLIEIRASIQSVGEDSTQGTP